MGLRCSVLGHDYGDPEVRREREERGSEVLVTVREVETCGRCDSERVTSENKEVTSITDPPERPEPGSKHGTVESPDTGRATDADAPPSSTDSPPADPASTSPPSPAEEDAEIIDADAPTGSTESDTETAADAGAEAAAAETSDAADEAAGVTGDEPAATAGAEDDPVATAATDEPDVPVREAESSAQTTLGDPAGSTATDDETVPESSDDDAADAATEPGVAVDTGQGGLDPESGDWPEGPERDDHEYDANRGRWPEPDDVSRPVHGEGDADAPWPEVAEDADEGFDAEVGGESPADVEFGGGLTPQRRRGTAAEDDPDTPDPRRAPGDGEDEPAEKSEDAELLEDTELNEQSEVTAEAPVDPATGDAEDGGKPPGAADSADDDDAIDELMEKTAERPAEEHSAGADAADSPARADDASPMTDTGIARPDPSPGERAGGDRSRPGTRRAEPLGELDSPVTEYHCPECGYTEASATSSLRAGDICPECRRGYLGEREQ